MRTINLFAFCVSAGSAMGLQSSVHFINADDVHSEGITGNGVTVAVIDAGIDYSQPGLAGSIQAGGASFEGGFLQPDPGQDIYDYGHGTYMSLIITDRIGVAPDARILPVRVFGRTGSTTIDVVAGINYVRLRRLSDPSIRVINLSLGTFSVYYSCPCDSSWQDYEDAISAALANGIITFAATGNKAVCGGISAPACVSSAVRVAASYDASYTTYGITDFGICGDSSFPAYWITCFSNIADCNYLLAAPGYDISVGPFQHGWGTSQATAHCSGVAALMFDKNGCGGMDAYLAKTIIFNQAATKDFPSPRCFVGNGTQPKHVNAIAAVDFVPPSPPCPGSGLVADLDCDMAIGPSDFQKLLVCVTGAGVGPIGGGCTCADFPESPPDGDVDLRDFIHFTRAYSGNTSSPAAVTLNLSSPSAGQTVQPGATISWSLAATVSATDNDGLAAISVDLVQDAGNPRFFDIPSATVVGSGMEGFSPPDGVANPGTGGSGYGGTPLGTAGAKNLRQIGGTQNTFGEEGHTGVGTDFDVDPSVGQSGAQVIAQGSFTAPGRQGTYVFRIENGLANVLDTVNPQPTPPASWPASSANVNLSSSSFTVTVPYDVVPLDFDADGDVDLDDFAEMQACYDPYGSVASGCADQDVNGDNVVNDMDV